MKSLISCLIAMNLCSCALDTASKMASDPVNLDLCGYIGGTSFVSIDKLDVGLGPDGVLLGHWELRFSGHGADIDAGQFWWQFSDAGAQGSYRCQDDGSIQAESNGGWTIIGKYNLKNQVLTWDGKAYVRDEGLSVDICSPIKDATFVSVQVHDGGLGPDGPTTSYWSLNLKDDRFYYQFSDAGQYGSYTCVAAQAENALILRLSDGSTIPTTINWRTLVLTLRGRKFALQNGFGDHSGQEHQNGGMTPDSK